MTGDSGSLMDRYDAKVEAIIAMLASLECLAAPLSFEKEAELAAEVTELLENWQAAAIGDAGLTATTPLQKSLESCRVIGQQILNPTHRCNFDCMAAEAASARVRSAHERDGC